MKKTFLISLSVITLILSGCASKLIVLSEKDDTIDFSKYTTFSFFGWDKGSDLMLQESDQTLIEKVFGNEFKSRGIQNNGLSGEIIVTLFVSSSSEDQYQVETVRATGYGGYYGHGPGWGWNPTQGYSFSHYKSHELKNGTIVCSVYDRQQKVLIWEGVVKNSILTNDRHREQVIVESIKELMKTFPKAVVKKQ